MEIMEVRAEPPAETADAYEWFLRTEHLPAIWRTGCFARIDIERNGEGSILIRYAAATAADLEHYLSEHAPHFRAEFMERFANTGIVIHRRQWQRVQSWMRADGV